MSGKRYLKIGVLILVVILPQTKLEAWEPSSIQLPDSQWNKKEISWAQDEQLLAIRVLVMERKGAPGAQL